MKKNKKAFTLIELLVVIAIIGILATIVIINVASARGKAADAKVLSDLSGANKIVALCKAEGGTPTYPPISGDGTGVGAICGGLPASPVNGSWPVVSGISSDGTNWSYTNSVAGSPSATTTASTPSTVSCTSNGCTKTGGGGGGGGGMSPANDALVKAAYNNDLTNNITAYCDNAGYPVVTGSGGTDLSNGTVVPGASTCIGGGAPVWPALPSGYSANLGGGDSPPISLGVTLSTGSWNFDGSSWSVHP